jgi:hypothetical protein
MTPSRFVRQDGLAIITALLVMLLVSALLVGFTASVVSDQRFRGSDRDRLQSFYAAHAGLEKLTADLGNYFQVNYAPTAAQVNALTAAAPALPGVAFVAPGGGNGYAITWANADAAGNPKAVVQTISSGPYQGLMAMLTQYTMDVTAKTATGGETHLRRNLETVAIPVFQFGIFSDTDLSYFAGPAFIFGGRVHTNGNLFLASGSTLTLSDKVTAVGDVVRQDLSNGASINLPTVHNGTVQLPTAPGALRSLAPNEGSLTGFLGSAPNPFWTNISLTTYNGQIRNGATGAHALILPVVMAGGSNPDIVRRPASPNENVTNSVLFGERYFSKVSVRILLSDTSADIQNLPTVTATPPISLEPAAWPPAGYNGGAGLDSLHPPVAGSPGPAAGPPTTTANTALNAGTINVTSTAGFPANGSIVLNGVTVYCTAKTATKFQGCTGTPATVFPLPVTNGYLTPANTGTIGGFIKIEMENNAGVWSDVTLEILNHGFSSGNMKIGAGCGDPNPDAIIRLERIADMPANNGACGMGGGTTTVAGDFWPLTLFDTREALQRDNAPASGAIILGGVMYYVALDVRNLTRWIQGVGNFAGGSGPNANNANGAGYTIYFSDRRNNRNAASAETGEFGFEDIINPIDPNGVPNAVLDPAEDLNGNGALDTYGQFPSYNGVQNSVAPGSLAPLTGAARTTTQLSGLQAQVNRPVLFRRALKLINGSLGNIIAPGLSIFSENPVYIQGDWNASSAVGFGSPHVATAVIADAVTLLGNEWNDDNSFANPYNPGARTRATNPYYRVAIVAGKNPSFLLPAWSGVSDFGTDGGTHNFLRYLESGGTVNYQGSLVSFYNARQATGIYKCCNTVYSAPTRAYRFDGEFMTPALLPPLTPAFRDLDTLGFSQEIRPGK